ncbi:lipoprotein signal peptidase [Ornithobacterium rhinotracheale]|uniref:Lipoprotein signal peptidase n=1 Tax=Ornithobacterium rhinotracheale (strain ATCC 51463 / DSM 15997 / CCUG 23171 / CIP 104009 / LMG 9086) TaxID=867902 RepID=I4A2P8_ORNRL|nr:lipoprotein signal peptidase [Ornithobacterium rhinotracheale]AFL98232.1 lipoprotein signal peptidase [Ornithobacterium rhinotracheale DSM 15997]AIP99976.1 peptidase A8 [Ornithobacterium rhinotracheale ORT-UMN 88]KGB66132.1 peptidase A8 [Ornithobacterium rhinotracheale H06-030791]MBN3662676.1 lipoprotein signal peptidase [Ornithobacterium rhinotracheale]MCK0193467.1 lipoprotein signal peptidase [Ornithobacterium rhinotracheale]
MKKFAIIAIIIVIIDQVSKIYIKTHFGINSEAFDIFDWFKIVFVENPGMAYGMNWGGPLGKSLLAILRWIMCGAIVWAVTIGPWKKYMKNNYFIIPMSLILAGALGNVIDSTFYGVMFDSGTTWNSELHQWNRWYPGVSQLNFEGYAPLFQGCVVDMLYFPLFNYNIPEAIPIIGGAKGVFFSPVFNIADSAISVGGALLLIFQKKAFH